MTRNGRKISDTRKLAGTGNGKAQQRAELWRRFRYRLHHSFTLANDSGRFATLVGVGYRDRLRDCRPCVADSAAVAKRALVPLWVATQPGCQSGRARPYLLFLGGPGRFRHAIGRQESFVARL